MNKFGLLLIPVASASLMFAQATSQKAPENNQTPAKTEQKAAHGRRGDRMLQRLTADLQLSPDQQAKARAIFQKSWQETSAIRPKLREERAAVLSAVKSDNQQQIDRVIQANTQLNAQAEEIHAKAMAQFYALLNTDQKAKMDQKMDAFMNPMAHRVHPRERSGAQPSGSGR